MATMKRPYLGRPVPVGNPTAAYTVPASTKGLAQKLLVSNSVIGIQALLAGGSSLRGLCVDSNGNLYIGNQSRILKVDTLGLVTVLAGGTASGSSNGTGTAASFNMNQICTDGTNIYVADGGNNLIRKVVISSGVVTTLAGTGASGTADNATGTSATFSNPWAIAYDATNTCLYVSDFGGFKIRKVSLAGANPVTTLAGTGSSGSADNATGTSATLNQTSGMALDPTGNYLYFTDFATSLLRRMTVAAPHAVTTLAGNGTGGNALGYGTAGAHFNGPLGCAASPDGMWVFVLEGAGNRIRRYEVATTAVYGYIGGATSSGTTTGDVEGWGYAALLNMGGSNSGQLVADAFGNLFLTDLSPGKIKRVDKSGYVSNLVGSAATGSGMSVAGHALVNAEVRVNAWIASSVGGCTDAARVLTLVPLQPGEVLDLSGWVNLATVGESLYIQATNHGASYALSVQEVT